MARGLVSIVASRNGRFLQKITTKAQAAALGVPQFVKDAWVYAPEEAVLIKVKQCFRDLYKKSEQADKLVFTLPAYSKNARYSNVLASAEAAAVAAMPGKSLQGMTQALYGNDRHAAALQILREQQCCIESMQYPTSSSVGSNPVVAQILRKNQQFHEDQLAKANADTILRREQGQRARSCMGASGDTREIEDMARKPSDNSALHDSAGIINSILGPPDEAGRLSFQQAVAAQKAGLPSALNPNATSMDQAAGLPTSAVSDARARESCAPEEDGGAPLDVIERDQLAQELRKKLQERSTDGKMSLSAAIKATEKGSPNRGNYHSIRSSNEFGVGNRQDAAMLSFLQERQHYERPSQQKPACFHENQPELHSAPEPMVSLPSLSVLSAVVGSSSEPLPTTLEDANRKIEAARWVIAQLIGTIKRPGNSSSAPAARQSPVEESKPPPSRRRKQEEQQFR